MDKFLWMLVGAALSFVISMIVKYYDDKITTFLESTKFYASERGRKKAIADYREVLAFKEGRRDIYLMGMHRIGVGILAGVFAIGAMLGVYVVPLSEQSVPSGEAWLVSRETGILVTRWFSMIFAIAFTALSFRSFRVAKVLFKRYKNFEKYKDEIERKWGSVDPPTIQ